MKDMIEAAKGDTEIVDVCMIGAGCAGLNALFVASQYLGKTDRVVVADRHDAPGGLWNGVHYYSRLHRPHPAFTVGDIERDWDKPQEYLAARGRGAIAPREMLRRGSARAPSTVGTPKLTVGDR